jgi:hypothetical protein
MTDRIKTALLHAKQGVTDPQFARDQCALIVEQLEAELIERARETELRLDHERLFNRD